MAVFAKQLIAMKAFIEELSAQIIQLKNGGLIKSDNYEQDKYGFIIKHNGEAEFNNIKTKGMQATDMTTKGLTVMEKLTVDKDTQLQTINGIPVDQLARNHQATDPYSVSSVDYPIGTILLAHANPIPELNSSCDNVWIYKPDSNTVGRYFWNVTGTIKLPGTWRNSGRETGSGNTILIRRVN